MCIPGLGHKLCAEPCAAPAFEHLKQPSEGSSAARGGVALSCTTEQGDNFILMPCQLFIAVAVTVTYSEHVQTFLPSVVRAEFPANLACL